MALYWWNVKVSGAFYEPLHCLEVSLRNALHDQMRRGFGRDDWWRLAPLAPSGTKMVKDAIATLLRRNPGCQPSPDDVVAALTFGFWVSLLARGHGYDRHLWVPTLHRSFPNYTGPRQRLHENLHTMRLLRNRIMHYEPVHHRDLAADHAKLYSLIGYIAAEIAKEARALDRVPGVLAEKPRSRPTRGHRKSG
jgi:hypothetical protein